MHDTEVFPRKFILRHGEFVPSARQAEHSVLTEDIEIVLVLNDGKFILFQKIREFLVEIFLAEAFEIH